MQQNWHEITGLNADGAHDVNEYKNGFLVTSPISDDFQILDVRAPLKPKVLSTGNHPQPNDFLFHSGTWPRWQRQVRDHARREELQAPL